MQASVRLLRPAISQALTSVCVCQPSALLGDLHTSTSGALARTTSLVDGPSTSGRGVATWTRSGSVSCLTGLSSIAGLQSFTALALRKAGEAPSLAAASTPCSSAGTAAAAAGAVWSSLWGPVRWCQKGQPSRVRMPKSTAINDVIMPNTTQLKFGLYGFRALSGKRVAANTIEAVRRTVMRKIKKTARLWVRIEATVPVTKKPLSVRMGKGKGAISFYATAVRPGQIIMEMDRLPRTVALQALQAAQAKFPVKLGFLEWS